MSKVKNLDVKSLMKEFHLKEGDTVYGVILGQYGNIIGHVDSDKDFADNYEIGEVIPLEPSMGELLIVDILDCEDGFACLSGEKEFSTEMYANFSFPEPSTRFIQALIEIGNAGKITINETLLIVWTMKA